MEKYDFKKPVSDSEESSEKFISDAGKKDITNSTFEEAISATGYGKFNFLMLTASALPCLVQVTESLNLSFVIPIAHCDLDLRLEDKGILNAASFLGMILSGFFWGFLCDTLGRKRIIVFGYLVVSLFAVMAAFSTSFTFLLVTKFFTGLILNGPYSASISHLTEFHSAQHRSRIQLVRGIFLSLANLVLPFISWIILPRDWIITIGTFDFHSWNLFLLVCSLLPFTTGLVYSFLPESPKYLMSMGKNEEALKVFQTVYAINFGKTEKSYPVISLQEEKVPQSKQSTKKALQEGLLQMEPLFRTPYMVFLLISCLNAFSISTSSNTLKIWLPQLFQAINDYTAHHNGSGSSLCEMLGELTSQNSTQVTSNCTVNLDNRSVYINSIIVALVRISAFIGTVYINGFISSKYLSILFSFGNGIVSGTLFFAQDSATVLALSSLVSGFGSVVDVILINIALELFPTTLRTFAISLHLTAMRIGLLVGNVLFPYLLLAGCAPCFLYIAITSLCCGVFSFLYPNTDNRPLL